MQVCWGFAGALFVAAVGVSGCSPQTEPAQTTTVTVLPSATSQATAPPSSAQPTPPGVYAQDGLYSVRIPREGANAVIEPGRYYVQKVRLNEPDGLIMRCNTMMCGPEYPQNAETTSTVRQFLNGNVYVFAADVAVYIANAQLSKLD